MHHNGPTNKDLSTVEFMVWANHTQTKKDPAVHAFLHGGNFGHAAIRVTIPVAWVEQDNGTQEALASLRAALKGRRTDVMREVNKTLSVNGKPVITPCYEVYFSFWPDEAHQAQHLNSYETDMLDEWEGKEAPALDREQAKRVFNINNEEEINKLEQRNYTSTKRGFFDPRGAKQVYSGIKTILNFDMYAILDRLEAGIEKIGGITADAISQLRNTKSGHPDFNAELELIDARKKGILKQQSEINRIRERLAEGAIDSGLVLDLEIALARYIAYVKLLKADNQIVVELEKDLRTINDKKNITMGVPPDYITRFDSNMDMRTILDGIKEMANKKYDLMRWNCSSTALSILLKGLPEALQQDKIIAKHMRQLSKKKPPIYTPKKVDAIATYVQKLLIAYRMEQVSAERAALNDASPKSTQEPEPRNTNSTYKTLHSHFNSHRGVVKTTSTHPVMKTVKEDQQPVQNVKAKIKLFEELANKENVVVAPSIRRRRF